VPTVGLDLKLCPIHKNRAKINQDEKHEEGSVAPNGGKSLTLQQIMETMRTLQETVAASRLDQERI